MIIMEPFFHLEILIREHIVLFEFERRAKNANKNMSHSNSHTEPSETKRKREYKLAAHTEKKIR